MRWATVALLIGLWACKSESPTPEAAEDVGPAKSEASSPDALPGVDLRYRLPGGWVVAAPADAERVVDARLYPRPSEKFLVAPHLTVTVEPLEEKTSFEAAFEQVLESVRAAVQDKPGVQLLRSAKSTGRHPLGQVADIEVAYRVNRGQTDPGPEVVHRSWVLIRRRPDSTHVRVTLTMTYLSRDAERVDVEQAIAGFAPVEGGPDGLDAG